MKKIFINALILLSLVSCSDYDEINTNIYGATDKDTKAGGLEYGAPFQRMQQLVIPIGSPAKTTGPGNDLQNTDLISSGNYIGYFGNNNNWNGQIEASWNFRDDRMNYAYKNFYSNIFREWLSIKRSVGDSENVRDKRVLALANILKIAAWQRATDVFGPIVFINAGKGDINPPLDDQETVYKAMLEELETSVNILKGGDVLMKDYDAIYDGNVANWVKFGNSLMLRIAVRAHFKDASLASTYIQKAISGGVMEVVSDEAKIQNSAKMPLKNSMMPSVNEYDETRMGLTIWAYLKGYNDPRLEKYFTKGVYQNKEDFYAVVPTSRSEKVTDSNSPKFASRPNIDDNSPLFWMRTSEVLFLKAEAALFNLGGFTDSQAKDFYEEGVKMSFQENGISGRETTYLNQTRTPQDFTDYWYNNYYGRYSYPISNGNTSPKWDDLKGGKNQQEEQLQKIITQKYLAMYPNAVEAWTEYRRTGYPLIMKYADRSAPSRINCPTCFVPERFKYSATEYSTNPNLGKQLPDLLKGEDTGGTQLWWVRPDRPQQQ